MLSCARPDPNSIMELLVCNWCSTVLFFRLCADHRCLCFTVLESPLPLWNSRIWRDHAFWWTTGVIFSFLIICVTSRSCCISCSEEQPAVEWKTPSVGLWNKKPLLSLLEAQELSGLWCRVELYICQLYSALAFFFVSSFLLSVQLSECFSETVLQSLRPLQQYTRM